MLQGKLLTVTREVDPRYLVRARYYVGCWNAADCGKNDVCILQTIDGRVPSAIRNSFLQGYLRNLETLTEAQLRVANLFPFFFEESTHGVAIKGVLQGADARDIFGDKVYLAPDSSQVRVEWSYWNVPGLTAQARKELGVNGHLESLDEGQLELLRVRDGLVQAVFFTVVSELRITFPRPGQPVPLGVAAVCINRTDHLVHQGLWHELVTYATAERKVQRCQLS